MSESTRTERLTLYIILIAALSLRWLHLALVWNSDLVRVPIIDAAFYSAWAQHIAAQDFIGKGVFFMSPLYPYLLAFFYVFFGSEPGRVMALQGLMGAGMVYLLYRWAWQVIGVTPALVAAALAALYSPFIFYDATLLTTSLILFLSIIILNLSEGILKAATSKRLVGLGALIGLSALARPSVLLFPVLLALEFVRRKRKHGWADAGWLAVGVLVVLTLVGLRNLIAGGEFTLTTSSAGMNFYVGNNPEATGLYWEAPFLSSVEPQFEDEEYRRAASEALERELTTREAGRYWFTRALDWMLNEPLDYLALLAKKTFYFLSRAEFANNVSIYLGRAESPILQFNPIGWWIIAPLGLGGLILLWRRKGWNSVATLWIWFAAYFLVNVVFFVSSEYRLPAALALTVGAGYLLTEAGSALQRRAYDNALRILALGIAFLPVTNFRTDFIRRGENARMDWFNIGNTFLKRDQFDEAIARFNKSLAIDPYFSEALLRLGEAYYRSGRPEEAVIVAQKIGLEDPRQILTIAQGEALKEAYSRLSLGDFRGAMKEFGYAGWDAEKAAVETTRVSLLAAARDSFEAGKLEGALAAFKEVVKLDSAPDPSNFYNIGFINYQLGRLDSAEFYANRAMQTDTVNVPSAYLLARIYNATDRREQAEMLMRRVSPDSEARRKILDDIRAEMDSLTGLHLWQQALEAYSRYGKLGYETDPEDKVRLGRLQYEIGNYETALRLLTEAEATLSGDPKVPLYQGKTLMMLGRRDEALGLLQRCIALAPDNVEGRLTLASVYFSRGNVQKAWQELEAIGHLEIHNERLAERYRTLSDSIKARL